MQVSLRSYLFEAIISPVCVANVLPAAISTTDWVYDAKPTITFENEGCENYKSTAFLQCFLHSNLLT